MLQFYLLNLREHKIVSSAAPGIFKKTPVYSEISAKQHHKQSLRRRHGKKHTGVP